MYALPTTHRDGKATTSNITQGTLLGYGGSMKNFVYLNDRTGKIGRATHVTFNEAHLYSPVADLSPNSLALWGALNCAPASDVPITADVFTPPDQFCVFSAPSPFLAVTTVAILVRCNFDHLGLVFKSDPMSYRNIIVDVVPYFSASHLDWKHLLQFHTVIQIGQMAVFTVLEILSAIPFIDGSTHYSVSLIVAPIALILTINRPLCHRSR
jgi:hypothetical protein